VPGEALSLKRKNVADFQSEAGQHVATVQCAVNTYKLHVFVRHVNLNELFHRENEQDYYLAILTMMLFHQQKDLR
jgi:hypothetical protein